MKNILSIKITSALALACSLALPQAAGADIYGALSSRIAGLAVESPAMKIAVLEFVAGGGAGKNETSYVAEKMGLRLAGNKAVNLIERPQLEKVLKEAGLSSAAGGADDRLESLGNMLSVDAVVAGVVFAAGEKLRVFARLIDIKTGRVLLAAEGDAGSLPAGWEASRLSGSGGGFRDAVADTEDASCSGRRARIGRLNAELVAEKARYWSLRMRAPGFGRKSLTKNPGSEIEDPAVRSRFYRLLEVYYAAGDESFSGPGKRAEVAGLIKMEAEAYDECGPY